MPVQGTGASSPEGIRSPATGHQTVTQSGPWDRRPRPSSQDGPLGIPISALDFANAAAPPRGSAGELGDDNRRLLVIFPGDSFGAEPETKTVCIAKHEAAGAIERPAVATLPRKLRKNSWSISV
ncbi:hypothetical protein DL765_002417 [Monosporascus sp. GIB2]|nr:hypothetical protein DL765_002417 [Monosporascus sp. GIB2]